MRAADISTWRKRQSTGMRFCLRSLLFAGPFGYVYETLGSNGDAVLGAIFVAACFTFDEMDRRR